jgi:hypothetical protein
MICSIHHQALVWKTSAARNGGFTKTFNQPAIVSKAISAAMIVLKMSGGNRSVRITGVVGAVMVSGLICPDCNQVPCAAAA